LPLAWYKYYCSVQHREAISDAVESNLELEEVEKITVRDSLIWPIFCYDCICLFKHPSNWREELNSYSVQTDLADMDVIRIVAILLFVFDRQRVVDILNAPKKVYPKFNVNDLSSMLIKVQKPMRRGNWHISVSILHKDTIHSVLKEGRKTNWTWDK
jgi:hypothetical protein